MRPVLCLLLLCACEPATVDGGDSGAPPGDGGGLPGDGGVEALEVGELSWRLHDEVESMPIVSWTQSAGADARVEYRFEGADWLSSPAFPAVAGSNEQVLVGIPYETAVEWRVVVDGTEAVLGDPLTTGELPGDLPLAELTVSDAAAWLPGGNYLLCSINQKSGGWRSGDYWTFILDREGRPVWAMLTPESHWTLYAQVSVGRDTLLIDEATQWSDWDNGAGSLVHERYLDAPIRTVETPGLHHAFVQLPDTTLAWGSQFHGHGEVLVEKPIEGGEEREVWSAEEDWTGERDSESNGLFYVEATDSYLYSFYTNNSLVEVDRATGESLWWAGEARGGFDFVPASAQFYWQHGVSYTSTGTLLLSSEYENDAGDEETWLLEYEVDRSNETLDFVWGSSSDTLADTNGDAWRLENGNTLHVVGAAGVIREVDPAGEDVWRLDFHADKLLGRGEFIEDLYTLLAPRDAG
jgi:hypothetical protein